MDNNIKIENLELKNENSKPDNKPSNMISWLPHFLFIFVFFVILYEGIINHKNTVIAHEKFKERDSFGQFYPRFLYNPITYQKVTALLATHTPEQACEILGNQIPLCKFRIINEQIKNGNSSPIVLTWGFLFCCGGKSQQQQNFSTKNKLLILFGLKVQKIFQKFILKIKKAVAAKKMRLSRKKSGAAEKKLPSTDPTKML